ncbi:hypothetical protein GOODEAATRI_011352, partial [Goodea atripinnis]
DSQAAKALRDKYEVEIKMQCFANLFHLLLSDDSLSLGSMLAENINNDQIGPESSYTAEVENICAGSVPATVADLINRASRECVEVRPADASAKQEVCSGCGAVTEELPYLEILCVPDAQSNVLAPEAGDCKEEDSSETKSLDSFEKQGSLILLAWSKPPEDDADYKAEDEDGEAEQYQDILSSVGIHLKSSQCEKTIQERDSEEVDALAHHDAQFCRSAMEESRRGTALAASHITFSLSLIWVSPPLF